MPEKNNSAQNSTSAGKRWGNGERVDNPARGAARILNAARQCYTDSGVASTTIDDIATAAGVSRRTVYRYFENKDAVILAVVEQQAEPFFDQLQQELDEISNGDFRQLLLHCAQFTIEFGPKITGHQLLLGRQNSSATADFYLRSAKMRDQLRALLSGPFQDARRGGDIDPAWQLDELINWIGRLVYSFIQHPESAEKTRRLLQQYLLPLGGNH